jgi:hypothetical protein
MIVIVSKRLCRWRNARVNEMAFHISSAFDPEIFRIGSAAEVYHGVLSGRR